MLKVGIIAPAINAHLENGDRFQLSDYQGKKNVVIFFFPKAFTYGWTAQAKCFRDNFEALAETLVIGISSDEIGTLEMFRERLALPFHFISDPEKKIMSAYGVRRRFNLGTSRITYVIDKEGLIRSAYHDEISMNSHARKVISEINNMTKNRYPLQWSLR